MLTTLPLMSLCLAAAAMLFINRTHLIPIVVFIYCMHPQNPASHRAGSLILMFTVDSIRCGVLSQPGTHTIYIGIREFSTSTTRSCT